jgi:lysozyme
MIAANNGASNGLLNFLASCEGFSGTAYADSRGKCTIGYGHLLRLGPCTAADNALSVTQQAAMNQLGTDVNTAVTALNNNLTVPLSQRQFDAMVSLTFNMGMGRLQTHDVWGYVNAGNMAAVPGAIRSLGAGGPGIPARRANEANMFQNGVYANACYSTN